MAGHNKWSKVKRKKEVRDPKRAALFSKFARDITAAVKQSGGDETHSSVRAVVEQARAANVPNANIDRAIERGKGSASGVLEEVVYEAYGPGGVALVITGLTDNRNRTAGEVKSTLSDHGANLGTPGAASWAFTRSDDPNASDDARAGGAYTPHTTMDVSEDDYEKLERLTEALEALEDVTAVYTNAS